MEGDMPAQPQTYTQAQIINNWPCAMYYSYDGRCYAHHQKWLEGAPVCNGIYKLLGLRPGEKLDTCAEVTANLQ